MVYNSIEICSYIYYTSKLLYQYKDNIAIIQTLLDTAKFSFYIIKKIPSLISFDKNIKMIMVEVDKIECDGFDIIEIIS